MSQSPQQPVGDAPAPAADVVRGLRRMVGQSAARWKRLVILEALGLAIAAPLAYLWLVFFIDNLFHLPVVGRLLASLGFLAALAYLVASLVRRWRRFHFTEDQVALAMEGRTTGVQNRLINAIQIARDPRTGDTEFRRAVIDENYQRLQEIVLQQAAQSRPALIRVGAACAVIAVGLLFWSLRPEGFRNAATRIMLPLADVDPIYQTTLVVEPGDVEAAGDVTIRIHINGQLPAELTVLHSGKSDRGSESLPVSHGTRDLRYTFKDVRQSMMYAVRGGDFETPYYHIDVPTPSTLTLVKVAYQFPAYTKLPEKETQSAGGDLEALIGTKAQVTFVFDQPAEQATLHLQKLSPTTQPAAAQAVVLRKISPTEFAGEITFVDVESYRLETLQPNHPPHMSPSYALRVRADQDPSLELIGLNKQTEASVDAFLPLKAIATDDIGLDRVGLFARRVTVGPQTSQSSATATNSSADAAAPAGSWKQIEAWPADGALELHKDYRLSVAALGAVEGEKYEVALRGADTDPLKHGNWITGQSYVLVAGGEGVAMQLLYEQILQSEADLKSLIASEQAAADATGAWMQKLTPASGLRWDEKANLDALAAAMTAQAADQEKIRQSAGRTAREMVEQAGNLRFSTGMLADTEMVRAIRILESVKTRDNPQAMRSALADAKVTDERTIVSLHEILDQYIKFRQDWELSNMIPFVKMLADRQGVLRDESTKNAALAADKAGAARQEAGGRREAKIATLSGLSRVAFAGLAERVGDGEPIISKAFAAASTSLGASELTNAMLEATAHASAGRWADAAKRQDVAAKALAAIHQQLRAAQLQAAQQALALLKERAKSDLAAQQEIKKLQKGSLELGVDFDEKKLKLEDIIHMREVARAKAGVVDDTEKTNLFKVTDVDALGRGHNTGARQELSHLSLATSPDGMPPRFPNDSDRKSNKADSLIQEKLDDLAGKLLDEAEKLTDKYDTYNLTLAALINDPGHIGKGNGDLSSTGATSSTGNQKQPPANYGGAAREGRQGARAHGGVVGDEGVNRRGMDTPQEGQDQAPDQAGTIKQAHSDDEQKDASTGIGGKKVDAEHTNFSLADVGKWTDDMAGRMTKPQDRNSIVERQGDKLDPRVAAMLRDLGSNQEQVIERLKSIKKDLTNLYLPTDQIDDLIAELNANFQSLRERPTAEVFRTQLQTLDKLRSTVRVLGEAGAAFQPSVPRDQAVRGPVLDEPARQTITGYEDAVKNYYQMLSVGE